MSRLDHILLEMRILLAQVGEDEPGDDGSEPSDSRGGKGGKDVYPFTPGKGRRMLTPQEKNRLIKRARKYYNGLAKKREKLYPDVPQPQDAALYAVNPNETPSFPNFVTDIKNW